MSERIFIDADEMQRLIRESNGRGLKLGFGPGLVWLSRDCTWPIPLLNEWRDDGRKDGGRMTEMTDEQRAALLALAERCEAATGPDRALDAAIFATLFPKELDNPKHYARFGGINRADLNYLNDVGVKLYTASIDAALTLVPDGWNGRLGWCRGAGYAELFDVAAGEAKGETHAAATLPLAICAAALRARAAQ